MVVLNNKGESGNQLKNKLKAITDTVSEVMPEVEIEGVTNKKGMIRKTAHQYNKQNFSGSPFGNPIRSEANHGSHSAKSFRP